jgi:hypothetical protein
MSHQIKLHYAVSTEHPQPFNVARHASGEHRALMHTSVSGAPCDCPPNQFCVVNDYIIAHEPPLLVALIVIFVVVAAVAYSLGKRAAIRRQGDR